MDAIEGAILVLVREEGWPPLKASIRGPWVAMAMS
jgi:hypothetical protein